MAKAKSKLSKDEEELLDEKELDEGSDSEVEKESLDETEEEEEEVKEEGNY